ncbi:MAG: prepilin-type N-terminal cleavage/methylation domain-containing protein [Sedimentisphaerales bacterium]|nr:prepilin-type N-terminal cleavage/methylation domain-containing protein [Sedimentisphaerales bacterium]
MNNSFEHNKSCGFTLLELLVAMALMGLVAMALYSSMYIGTKAKQSCYTAVKPYRALNPALEFIRKDLTCALEPRGILAAQFQGNDLIGTGGDDADSLLFYCSTHIPSKNEIACDIIKTEYALEERQGWDELVLVRKRTINLLTPKTIEAEEEVICRDIRALDIKYYDGYDWLDSWDSTTQDNALPLAVEVAITLADAENTSTLKNQESAIGTTMKKTIFLSCAETRQ